MTFSGGENSTRYLDSVNSIGTSFDAFCLLVALPHTPDDVYYSSSPNIPVAKAETKIVQEETAAPADGEYQSYWGNSDDNYLKMKVQNGGRWNSIDDYSYWNGYSYNNGFTFNPYMYNYSYNAFNSYNPWGYQNYNNYWGHNSWYNGYGYPYGYA
eukprot:gene58040-79503_t